jgi:hypothetical protein
VHSARSSVEHHRQSGVVPNEGGFSASGANLAAPSNATSAPAASTSSSGFDWGDAGIGAVAMLLFVSVGAGGLLAIRRNRGRGHAALTG